MRCPIILLDSKLLYFVLLVKSDVFPTCQVRVSRFSKAVARRDGHGIEPCGELRSGGRLEPERMPDRMANRMSEYMGIGQNPGT